MKKVIIYLERITSLDDRILFSDGISDIWIPKRVIIRKKKIKNNDYEVVIPIAFAIESGII